jgi:hypothetical protein
VIGKKRDKKKENENKKTERKVRKKMPGCGNRAKLHSNYKNAF